MSLMRIAGWLLVAVFGGVVALVGQKLLSDKETVVLGASSAEPSDSIARSSVTSKTNVAPLIDADEARGIVLQVLASAGIRTQAIRQGRHALRGPGRSRSETMPLISFACSAAYSCLSIMANIERQLEPVQYQLIRSKSVDRPDKPVYRAVAKGSSPVLALRAYPPNPRLTVVISDVGREPATLDAMLALDPDVTYAVSVNEPYAKAVAERLVKEKREFIAHLPMEPSVADKTDGPAFLTRDMSLNEVQERTRKFLDFLPGAVGADGHLGGGFSSSEQHIGAVLEVLAQRGLFFLDQRPTDSSVATARAKAMGVRSAAKTHRLDASGSAVEAKLRAVEVALVLEGHAVVVADPSPKVLTALGRWLKNLRNRKIHLIRLSETVL
ncbi:MAG: divergent polysaccharide deacetylase family protein [Myxococcota bacterium]|nr:divergent polysaccharide deacetylase family protein [Myxococcota bacterium]